MKVAILDLCIWLPEFQTGQAKFGELIASWIKQGLPEGEFTVIDIVEGEAFPELSEFDGFVISGSDKGVYDDTKWMADLREFLLKARAENKPMFGICFGHQIMADVFGGKAEKVGDQQVGVREFVIDGKPAPAHVWHQDQVTMVPPGAEVIASSDYCPLAGLAYDFPALSVQFHPEYPAEYIAHFLKRGRGSLLTEQHTDAAVEEFSDSSVPANLFAKEVGDFFTKTLR